MMDRFPHRMPLRCPYESRLTTTIRGQCPQGLLCCQGIASSPGDLRSQVPDDFLDQLEPGADNQFLSLEGEDIALWSGSDPLSQPFADVTPGLATFDIVDDVNLAAFQVGSSPADFGDPYSYLTGSSIVPSSNDDNQQFEASNPDFSSFFYPLDG